MYIMVDYLYFTNESEFFKHHINCMYHLYFKTIMKYILSVLLLSFQFLNAQTISPHIHIDQFGYLQGAEKVAVISDPQSGYNANESYSPGTTFEVIDTITGNPVFSGVIAQWDNGNTHNQSGDKGWWFDFSAVNTPGEYFILDPTNNTRSYHFTISSQVYNPILESAFKMFYYNRCNHTKELPYASSNWVDGNNFENALQDSFCRYIYDPNNQNLEKELSGGWFDAGDYNKYVTFAAKPLHQLLFTYEESGDKFSDFMNIPESNNGYNDLLDEIKWELDWLMKMTNADGSTINKMGSINYLNSNSPPSTNYDQRYYGPTCTSSSIAAAGILAHAALIYKEIPGWESFGSEMESQAIQCFNYVLPHLSSNSLETNCDDGTINAGDADWPENIQKEEAVLAATFLFMLTDSAAYHNYLINNINDVSFIATDWLGNTNNEELEVLLKYTNHPNADPTTISEIINSITPHISQDWNNFYGFNALDLYRSYMPDWSYHWGSNQPKAEYALLNHLVKVYDINPSENMAYAKKTSQHLHYFHGVNPQNMVYLSNMYALGGNNCANEIYHAWFADGTNYDNAINSLYGPAPGFVTGGPNKDFTVSTISPPAGQPIQKAYLDFNTSYPDNSWEITEPAIYYQAYYLRLLALFTEEPCLNTAFLDQSASGINNGLNWENAFTSLDEMFTSACFDYYDTIRIAEGTYIPQTTARNFSYPFQKSIFLEGGFSSGGISKNPSLYQSILSGNINNNSLNSDNLFHAFSSLTPDITIYLKDIHIRDGYTIQNGNEGKGAGIYSESNLVLENITISNNAALFNNQGIYCKENTNVQFLRNTKIENNIKL